MIRTTSKAWEHLFNRFSRLFVVERVSLHQIDPICDFFKRAYADQPVAAAFQDDNLLRRRWRWLNEEYPLRRNGELPAWVCLRKGEIVGHFGTLPAVAVVQGWDIPICWARDLIVAPEARQHGVGPFLVMTAIKTLQCPLLVAGMNKQSYALFRQLGFEDGGRIPLYVKVLRPSQLHEVIPGRSFKNKAVRGALRTAQFLANRLVSPGPTLSVAPLDQFNDQFDQWWASIENAFQYVVRRTSATMAWRYLHHPAHKYHIGAARSGSSVRGIIVMRHGWSRGVPAGFITEILAQPNDSDAIDSLISYAQQYFAGLAEKRLVFLRCGSLHKMIEKRLLRAGFLPVASPLRWMGASPPGVASLDIDKFRQRWFLNSGDSDLDGI